MSLFTVVIFLSCVFAVGLAGSNDTISIMKRSISQTQEKTKEEENIVEKLKKEIDVQAKKCQKEIRNYQTTANGTGDKLKWEIETLYNLRWDLIEIGIQEKSVTQLIAEETNNLKKIELELTLMQENVQLLTERRKLNESTRCRELMNAEDKPQAVGHSIDPLDFDTIVILQNQMNLANGVLHQTKLKREELETALHRSKELCEIRVANQNNDQKNDSVTSAEISVKNVSDQLNLAYIQVHELYEKLAKVVQAKDERKSQFLQLLSEYKEFDGDQACYKSLRQNVTAFYSS